MESARLGRVWSWRGVVWQAGMEGNGQELERIGPTWFDRMRHGRRGRESERTGVEMARIGRQGTVGRGEDGTRRGLWRMGQARIGRNGTARMRSGRDRNKASRTGGKGLAGRHGSDEAGTWIGLGSGPDGQGKV